MASLTPIAMASPIFSCERGGRRATDGYTTLAMDDSRMCRRTQAPSHRERLRMRGRRFHMTANTDIAFLFGVMGPGASSQQRLWQVR